MRRWYEFVSWKECAVYAALIPPSILGTVMSATILLILLGAGDEARYIVSRYVVNFGLDILAYVIPFLAAVFFGYATYLSAWLDTNARGAGLLAGIISIFLLIPGEIKIMGVIVLILSIISAAMSRYELEDTEKIAKAQEGLVKGLSLDFAITGMLYFSGLWSFFFYIVSKTAVIMAPVFSMVGKELVLPHEVEVASIKTMYFMVFIAAVTPFFTKRSRIAYLVVLLFIFLNFYFLVYRFIAMEPWAEMDMQEATSVMFLMLYGIFFFLPALAAMIGVILLLPAFFGRTGDNKQA